MSDELQRRIDALVTDAVAAANAGVDDAQRQADASNRGLSGYAFGLMSDAVKDQFRASSMQLAKLLVRWPDLPPASH